MFAEVKGRRSESDVQYVLLLGYYGNSCHNCTCSAVPDDSRACIASGPQKLLLDSASFASKQRGVRMQLGATWTEVAFRIGKCPTAARLDALRRYQLSQLSRKHHSTM